MNALANSQIGELDAYFKDVVPQHRVTYRRYTGQEDQDERRRIADNPPDILLTNFMMLELLLTRQDELDQRVVANCEDLDFLVLDELHTYRGRQGADVAMLVRRLRDRLAPGKDILCVGTSATMTSEGGQGGREVVADIASKLFATTIHPTDVVIETLERRTDPMQSAETVKPRLAAAIRADTPYDATDAVLAAHPLAIWAETTLGIEQEPNNGPWIRATPRSLSEAAKLLAGDSGVDERDCQEALKTLLLVASRTEQQRAGRGSDKPFFGVRLHQFISGAGRAHSTIEPFGVRKVVLDAQVFLPEGDGRKATLRATFLPQLRAGAPAGLVLHRRRFEASRGQTHRGFPAGRRPKTKTIAGSASSCRFPPSRSSSMATTPTTPRRGPNAPRTATSVSFRRTAS